MSNFLGTKVVVDCDLIFEFEMVGQNFGAQDKNPDCPRHYKLQCQRGHVVLSAENGTALADRRNRLMFASPQVLNYNDKGGLEFGNSPRS